MVARTLAETGLAPLYTGLLKMLARQQDRPNVIRIRGQWIPIDPRALGHDVGDQRSMSAARACRTSGCRCSARSPPSRSRSIQMGGLANPLAGVPEYRNTLARMLETVNIADVSGYFKALPPDFQPPPAPPPPPNTDLVLAQVQKAKTAADVENDRADQQTETGRAAAWRTIASGTRRRSTPGRKTWVAAAQFGTPAPAFDEFKAAMKSAAPAVGMLSDLPSPNSPAPPAIGAPPPTAKAPRAARPRSTHARPARPPAATAHDAAAAPDARPRPRRRPRAGSGHAGRHAGRAGYRADADGIRPVRAKGRHEPAARPRRAAAAATRAG